MFRVEAAAGAQDLRGECQQGGGGWAREESDTHTGIYIHIHEIYMQLVVAVVESLSCV